VRTTPEAASRAAQAKVKESKAKPATAERPKQKDGKPRKDGD
jgi:hypothetical protein